MQKHGKNKQETKQNKGKQHKTCTQNSKNEESFLASVTCFYEEKDETVLLPLDEICVWSMN